MKGRNRARIAICAVLGLMVCSSLLFLAPSISASSENFLSLSIDGYIKSSRYYSYSDAHDDTTGGVIDNDTYFSIIQDYESSQYQILRAALFFDTSSIPDGASIISAKISLYCTDKTIVDNFDIVIVSGADLSDNGLIAADYGDLLDDTVSRGSLNTASISLNQYNDFSLNSAGMSEISTTGITKFGLRSSTDIDATPPTDLNEVGFSSYEAGASYRPKLEVIYNAVDVSISPVEQIGTVGQTLSFTVTVTNLGETTDNYDLVVSDTKGWAILSDNLLENIAPDSYESATLTVTVGTVELDTITVTATSQTDNAMSDDAICFVAGTYGGGGGPLPPPENKPSPPGPIPNIPEIIEKIVEPSKNILFKPLFHLLGFGISLLILLIIIALLAHWKKQRGIFWSAIAIIIFLIPFGSRLV